MLDSKKVGLKLASLRKAIGYSQEKLAEIMRVTPQAISKWENGHSLPETGSLPLLAQIFGCGIDDIIMPAYSSDEHAGQDIAAPPKNIRIELVNFPQSFVAENLAHR
ncbi:MAG: helix-turn-helix transcriptional regulator [Defluviitaleaceae bacterium]|nr:helix-turn-helix transcriptional regulator [Defluviitaleaceae bacterium]